MRPDALTDMQVDALTEVGSIGAGHAATALSQLVDHRIDLEVPYLEVLSISDIPTIFGGPETLAAGVFSRLLGDLEGSILFVVSRASAITLVDMLHNRVPGETRTLGHEDEEMVAHAASIVASSYLAAIARMAGLTILPTAPSFALDMVGGILQAVAIEVGMMGQDAIVLRTEFRSDEGHVNPNIVDAYLFFLPTPESLEILLGRLGMS